MRTQWRIGAMGREGLDYNVLFRFLDDRFTEKDEWQSAFADVQMLEIEALNLFGEARASRP